MIEFKNNEMYVEGVRVSDIASKFGTPTYVYSLKRIEENINIIFSTFDELDFHLNYAVKANANLHLLRVFRENGCGVDTVSYGEIQLARTAGFSPDEIVLNGVGKEDEELKFAIENDVYAVNCDSEEELKYLDDMANSENKRVRVALRVNPNIDAQTHPHITTGLKENKFGIDLATAKRIIDEYRDSSSIDIVGLHTHIGSQIISVEPYVETFLQIKKFMEEVGKQFEHYNIGGGWGIDYKSGQRIFNVKEYKEKAIPILKSMNVKIVGEFGRFIIGNASLLLTKVLYNKHTPYKNFVVVDTGMNHLIRPVLYNAYHRIIPVERRQGHLVADIVGPLCESADFLGKDRDLTSIKRGDLLVIMDVGAYGYAMSSNYNGRFRGAEVLIDRDKVTLIRRREDINDLLSTQKV